MTTFGYNLEGSTYFFAVLYKLDNKIPLLKNQFEMNYLIVDAATTEVESAGGLEGNLKRIQKHLKEAFTLAIMKYICRRCSW